MPKKIMVVAGSRWQIPITKKIKDMGHLPHVVNLYEDSPAFLYATKSGVMDILDKDACLKFATENKIDAILSEECDIAMPTVAYIADNLNLPSQGADKIALFTNKFKMREFCRANGLKFPEYRKCSTFDEAAEFFKTVGGKIIIKPLDANSSRGVFTITSEEELELYFEQAMSFSKVEKCVLAERYIEGTEFTIDGIKTPDRHYSLAISEKKHYPHNKNIAYELYFSHNNSNFDYEKLKAVNDEYVNLSGLPFGLTHAEYKYENGEYYLIEIAARGGGNLISSDIVPVMSEIDNYKYLIDCSIGECLNENFEVPESLKERCCVLRFFDAPADGGTVKEIEGTDILTNDPRVIKWELNFKVGDYIEKAKDDSKRIGFYIAYADNDKQLKDLMHSIEMSFKIILD
ncbi:MAG: ATP-grasp domain-containing protein [Clostridia bacterium]|nr:ATP-grasp domain-containing protein [Clostridia bacterium]